MGIPKSYIPHVLRVLANAGYLTVERGQNGGYFLAKPAEDISMLDVLNVMEKTTRLNRCLEEDGYCDCFVPSTCPAHYVFDIAQQKFDEYFSSVSIADLFKVYQEQEMNVHGHASSEEDCRHCLHRDQHRDLLHHE